MPWWGWLIIAFAILVLMSVALFVIKEHYHRKDVLLEKSDEMFNKMLATTEVLISMCSTNIDIREKLESIHDSLKYCVATNDKKVIQIDNRIALRIDDLKISVSRAVSKGTFHSVKKVLAEIELLIVERNALLKDYRS